MSKIKKIQAYEIIDSRGYPTIEARIYLDNDLMVRTSIPAGNSENKYEAIELRDNDSQRMDGMGVKTSVAIINDQIAPKLIGISPLKQLSVDQWLIKADGTKNKSRLGANTILAISQLMAKAGALDLGIPVFKYINQLYSSIYKTPISLDKIPTPMFNIINGGKHSNNNLEFQEFHIIPSSSNSFSKAFEMGVEIFHELKRVLLYRNASISVGEEGGLTPNLAINTDAIEVIKESISQKNLRIGLDVFIGLNIAAKHFYKDERYFIKDRPHPLKVDEYLEFITNLTKTYSILVIEDPFVQDDWENWQKLNKIISNQIYLVGGDLLSTNKERMQRAIKDKTCSSILIKPNQIGTVTENLEIVNIARNNNFSYIVSHRSGETNDDFIADFAVGTQADFVKFGAPSRGERIAKYNRLWQIERDELK